MCVPGINIGTKVQRTLEGASPLQEENSAETKELDTSGRHKGEGVSAKNTNVLPKAWVYVIVYSVVNTLNKVSISV